MHGKLIESISNRGRREANGNLPTLSYDGSGTTALESSTSSTTISLISELTASTSDFTVSQNSTANASTTTAVIITDNSTVADTATTGTPLITTASFATTDTSTSTFIITNSLSSLEIATTMITPSITAIGTTTNDSTAMITSPTASTFITTEVTTIVTSTTTVTLIPTSILIATVTPTAAPTFIIIDTSITTGTTTVVTSSITPASPITTEASALIDNATAVDTSIVASTFITTSSFTAIETVTIAPSWIATETSTLVSTFIINNTSITTEVTTTTTAAPTTQMITTITVPTTTETSTLTSIITAMATSAIASTFIITDSSTITETTAVVTPSITTEASTSVLTSMITSTSVTTEATTTISVPPTVDTSTPTIVSTTMTSSAASSTLEITSSSTVTETTTAATSSITTEAITTTMNLSTVGNPSTIMTSLLTSAAEAMTSFTTASTFVATSITNVYQTTTFTTTVAPSCNDSSQILWSNGSCMSKTDVQIITVNILRNGTANATTIAQALSSYISSITDSNVSPNPAFILSAAEIDFFLAAINNVNLTINTNSSFLLAQPPNQAGNTTVLGASFTRSSGGQVVKTQNVASFYNSSLSAAAIINYQSLVGSSFLSMLIIDKPITYRNIDNSTNQTLASSVIVVALKRNNSISTTPMNISLYFQVLSEYLPTVQASYVCSYYNTNYSKWDESGCTTPTFNTYYNRYECNCNHLSTFALLWLPPPTCNPSTQIQLPNTTCVSKSDGQIATINILRSNTTNSTVIAEALSLYISSITNSNVSSNSNYTLTVSEIDNYLSSINSSNLTINTNDSFLMANAPNQPGNAIVLGASFVRGTGGQVVNTLNEGNVISSNLSTAAILNYQSLSNVKSLNMIIINSPTAFQNIDNSTNKTLASSVVMVNIQRNSTVSSPINISLFFQILNEFRPNVSADYYCSYYDTYNLRWNESGCSSPTFNTVFNRYECSCDHLTSFALLWLPQGQLTTYLNASDIASLVCLSISIVCFLAIIIHAIALRIRDPVMGFKPYELVPLLSCASTTILFIFYIALGMTVYTKTSSTNESRCFLSSSVLMFFVYFFLIFMFCTKTSVGYFNYLRFICLFPQPSIRKLLILLILSFLISITCVAFAIGFNSSSSYNITQLYPYKLCWFTRDVIYYFLTIPVGVFLLINTIVFILVALRIINHARHATSPHQSYERMKRCVLILLSSSATQGIGWLFGPFLTFVNPEAGNILGWFFIIFNGLEGLWSIILYIILRSKHMDEQKRVTAAKQLSKTISSKLDKDTKSSMEVDRTEIDFEAKESELKHRPRRIEAAGLFDDSTDIKDINWPSQNDTMRSYSQI
ncbi:unnamed protein product [Rotaria magnacalcarata]